MEKLIHDLLLRKQQELFGIELDRDWIQFQKTRKDMTGDLTLVLFPFVKTMGVSPKEIGQKIADEIQNLAEVGSSEIVGGFLNISASQSYWLSVLSEINSDTKFGFQEPKSKSTVMVEYSSPNTNKPLHLGHLRNNFLGYSVAEILKAHGYDVIKTQIINDRGIHICKSMLAWEKFSPLNEKGERETPANTGLKGDKLVGKYYVEFDKNFVKEAKEIIAGWENGDFDGYSDEVQTEFERLFKAKDGIDDKVLKGLEGKILDLAKNQTTLLLEAKEMLVKWEAKDPQTYLLWSTMNSWVYKGFDVTYEKMGVDFDKLYYESDTFITGKDLVIDGLQQGIFFKKDDGSVWIDLTADGLDEKLVLRSDGTAVYMTQDMGTAFDRYRDYQNLDGIIYTVGNEQDYHFQVLFLVLAKLGYSWAKNCQHLSYGMVDLPTGKMKSREGTVVDADDLIDEIVEKAKEATMERGHIEGMSEAEVTKLCKTIGLGGLKYYLLKVDPKKRMMFNPEESIELNGNTGPFIQYAYARIQSLLSRAKGEELAEGITLLPEEIELIKQMNEAPKILEEAASNLSPAIVANYLFELVKSFNHFYQNVSIFNEEDSNLQEMRLVIAKNTAAIIKNFCSVLGISVPNKM
ncbi:arginine--tRNA ligase [Crocinitomicaceae bacterium]|nr:arginine--tRNA ligase [Crocinitomicaceae bacterium]